jgi:hypothetical protein
MMSQFIIDEERLLEMPNIYNPDNLNGKLRIHDDYASAIAIYEAYEMNLKVYLLTKNLEI